VREVSMRRSLAGIVLPDVGSGQPLDLGALPGRTVLTLIRHRF
jgi:hypothetical protein